MTKYIVKLTEQEELSIKQMMLTPGADVLLRLLQIESLDAQAEAMECNGTGEQMLLALAHAKATKKVTSNLTKKLWAYRESMSPVIPQEAEEDPMGLNILNIRTN